MSLHETLEVLNSAHLKLHSGVLVAHKQSSRVHLKRADSPHVVNAFLNGHVQSIGLVGSRDQNHHFTRIHDSANAHCQRKSGHFGDIIVEEARIGKNSLLSERLDACARDQA